MSKTGEAFNELKEETGANDVAVALLVMAEAIEAHADMHKETLFEVVRYLDDYGLRIGGTLGVVRE